VNPFEPRLLICGAGELDRHKPRRRVTHWISIANPGAPSPKPSWFAGERLQLWFGDVVSEADARRGRTQAPTVEDVRHGVEFFRTAWQSGESLVLISCDYGASRSPALAYVCIADQLGPGRESEALSVVLKIGPDAAPNRLVVELGDTLLERKGALLKPLLELYSEINEEISKSIGF
jgi:predicted protein tyrosine phosphatase